MTTIFLLHDNLLSCNIPVCGNVGVKASVIAIGNKLRLPTKKTFPAWVLKYERDPLLWISGTDGRSFLLQISGAIGLFTLVLVSKIGSARLLGALSGLGAHVTATLLLTYCPLVVSPLSQTYPLFWKCPFFLCNTFFQLSDKACKSKWHTRMRANQCTLY